MILKNRKSPRATWIDYSAPADYHVTICTKKMEFFFGEIQKEKMVLSEEGKIAERILIMILEKYPSVEIDEFIIMPNHIHILIGFRAINKKDEALKDKLGFNKEDARGGNKEGVRRDNGEGARGLDKEDAINRIRTGGACGKENPMIKFSISTVIRWFTGRCSYEIRKINPNFSWHGRFNDSLIKSKKQYENTKAYIQNNPLNWNQDKYNRK